VVHILNAQFVDLVWKILSHKKRTFLVTMEDTTHPQTVNGRFSWQDEYGPHPLELKLLFLRIMNFVPDSVI